MTEKELEAIYAHTLRNRAEIAHSVRCGCAACEELFDAADVEEYIDDGQTVLCPCCGVDAVIGDAASVELTAELLAELNKKYF